MQRNVYLFYLEQFELPKSIRNQSCVNQLLAATHEMYKSFDERFQVRGFFINISKALDNVWHEVLLLKLNQNNISGYLLELFRDFLSCRKQRVVLNDQHSSLDNVTARFP